MAGLEVRFVDKLGTDLTVVNAARVSFDKHNTKKEIDMFINVINKHF